MDSKDVLQGNVTVYDFQIQLHLNTVENNDGNRSLLSYDLTECDVSNLHLYREKADTYKNLDQNQYNILKYR